MSHKWLFQVRCLADWFSLSLFKLPRAAWACLTYPCRFVVEPAFRVTSFRKCCPPLWSQMPLLFLAQGHGFPTRLDRLAPGLPVYQ